MFKFAALRRKASPAVDDRLERLHKVKRYISEWHDMPMTYLLEPAAKILRMIPDVNTYSLLIKIHISNDMLELVEEITMEVIQ